MKGREGAAVIEIHAYPVPALCAGVHDGLAAFVVQPGPVVRAGFHRQALAVHHDGAADLELRLTVVVAGLFLTRAFA